LDVQGSARTFGSEVGTFAPTQWSVVVAAGESQANPEASRIALANLCESYWPPLYTYLRARGYSKPDAQDLTQGFFAYLIERKIYRRTDREKGKFRSFLLASLKNFVADARDREQTLKRGGGQHLIPLTEAVTEAAESLLQSHSSSGSMAPYEDVLFERSWADTLVNEALDGVARLYEEQGKRELFQELRPFLAVGTAPVPTYEELSARLRVSESTLRSQVTRLRARYREVLREEVRRTVNTEAEIDDELRELLRVLTDTEGS
jgi:RNA polymerase sigma factor (sigma-70 family)